LKKIYVAGASSELDMIRYVMKKLQDSGNLEITYDWTIPVAKFGSEGKELTSAERREYAAKDLAGVGGADYFWLLVPGNKSVGAWVELGAAISNRRSPPTYNRPVIVVSGDLSSIFTELADKRFTTHEEALTWLLK